LATSLTICFMDRGFLEYQRRGRTCWSSLGPSLGRSSRKVGSPGLFSNSSVGMSFACVSFASMHEHNRAFFLELYYYI
jgi:hypothetical protein